MQSKSLYVANANGLEAFNLKLFDKTLGKKSLGEINGAQLMLTKAVREIVMGKTLDEYDGVAVAYISLADAAADLGLLDRMGLAYVSATRLYDRYSPYYQRSIDSITDGAASTRLLANTYKLMGSGFLTKEKVDAILEYLKATYLEIEEKGEVKRFSSGEKFLILDGLTHDDVGRAFIHLATQLRQCGEHSKAAKMIHENLFDWALYGNLTSSYRLNLRQVLRSLFPEEPGVYSVFSELIDAFDELKEK